MLGFVVLNTSSSRCSGFGSPGILNEGMSIYDSYILRGRHKLRIKGSSVHLVLWQGVKCLDYETTNFHI